MITALASAGGRPTSSRHYFPHDYSGYARYADAPEIVDLLEERLAAALKADGLALSPMTAEARLQILRRAHAAKTD